MNRRHQPQQGSVVLVTLCFVAVLGLMLAGYLALISRSLQLSNRSFQTDLSRHLAEAGMEEALRAFNAYDWSNWTTAPTNVTSGSWTLDAVNRRATRTITFSQGKLGQGITGSIKLRIDNYDAAELDSVWSSSRTYNIGDLVGLNGTWYRSVQAGNLNNNPVTQTTYAWWAPEPIPWQWSSHENYTANYDIVCYGSSWWICNSTHTSTTTFDWPRWTWIPAPSTAWTAWTYYAIGQFVYRTSNNTWYRCTASHNSTGTWDASKWTIAAWSYISTRSYAYNEIVNYNGTWYRFIYSTALSGYTPTSYPTVWDPAFDGSSGWSSSGVNYTRGTVVYYSSNSRWYRCIRDHVSGSITPTDTNYWSPAPHFSLDWDSSRQFNVGDVVRYRGIWYRCTTSNNNNLPTTYTSNWTSAANSSNFWNASTNYSVNSYVSYGGIWYRCLIAHSNRSPNNSTYWAAIGAPVIYSEGNISFSDGGSLRTQLRGTLSTAPLFPNAIAGTTSVNLSNSGSSGIVDSYNSNPVTTYTAIPASNYIAGSAGYSAVVASAGSVTTAGGTVKGYISTPSASTYPYVPSWTYGGSSVLVGSGSSGRDLARVSRSPYIPAFPINNQPSGVPLNVTSGFLGTPGATTPTVYTYSGNLTLNTTSEMLTVVGPTILQVAGNLRIYSNNVTGGARIRIATGGSLRLYVTGNFRIQDTGGGVDNQTLDPARLTILGSRSGTGTFEYSSSQPLYGTLYFPNITSAFTIDNNAELFGAISTQSITFADPAKVHYDTSLRYATIPGISQPHGIADWRELTAAERATMP